MTQKLIEALRILAEGLIIRDQKMEEYGVYTGRNESELKLAQEVYDGKFPKAEQALTQPTGDVANAEARANKLYAEMCEWRRKFDELRQRLEWNPDWMQCSEDARKLYAELRAEYHEVFEDQQKTIKKWVAKHHEQKAEIKRLNDALAAYEAAKTPTPPDAPCKKDPIVAYFCGSGLGCACSEKSMTPTPPDEGLDALGVCDHCGEKAGLSTILCGQKVCHECEYYSEAGRATPTNSKADFHVPYGYALISNQSVELLRRTQKWLAEAGMRELAIRRIGLVINDIDELSKPSAIRNTEMK